jgi:hypothetical protein
MDQKPLSLPHYAEVRTFWFIIQWGWGFWPSPFREYIPHFLAFSWDGQIEYSRSHVFQLDGQLKYSPDHAFSWDGQVKYSLREFNVRRLRLRSNRSESSFVPNNFES